jgi:hypothetical protein
MNKITIPLHSFVDLITNSSSEVFVEPTDKTKDVIYDIVNLYLKKQGIDKDAKDIIDIMFYVLLDDFDEKTQKYKEVVVYEGDVNFDSSCTTVNLEIIVRPEYENIKPFTDLLVNLLETIEGISKYC